MLNEHLLNYLISSLQQSSEVGLSQAYKEIESMEIK